MHSGYLGMMNVVCMLCWWILLNTFTYSLLHFYCKLLIINCRRENTIGRIQGYPPRHGLSTDLSLESIMFLVAGGAGRQRPEGGLGCISIPVNNKIICNLKQTIQYLVTSSQNAAEPSKRHLNSSQNRHQYQQYCMLTEPISHSF